MAATYYKYAERDADSQVNWAEIGKNMSDILLNEAKFREDKKQELDKLSREQSQALAQYPTGQSESARAMALKYSDDASKFMLMQDKLLKSGQMKLSDYTVSRQNLVDDTDTAFTMLKDFQSRYGIKMDRYKQGISQAWELEAMERIEGFGNFSESGMYIDPTSGKVMMSKKEIDPTTGLSVMSKDPAKMASIPSVRGMLEGQWDKYNPNDTLDKIKESTGEYMYTIREIGKKGKLGEIKSISDVLARTRQTAEIEAQIKIKQAKSDLLKGEKDKKKIAEKTKVDEEIISLQAELEMSSTLSNFEKYETDAINIPLVNEWNRLSLMTDAMIEAPNKKPYRFVYSEKDAMDPATGKRDESAILMVPALDGNNQFKPKFTDQQKTDTTEWMRTQLRGRYDYKETSQTVQDYSQREYAPQYVYDAGQKTKTEGDMVSQWMNIYSAKTAAEKDAAAEALLGTVRSLDSGVIDIDPTASGVIIKYSDGRQAKTIEYGTKDGYKSGDQWAAAGTILHGVQDQNIFNKYKGQTFNNLKGTSDTDTENNWSQVGAGYIMPTSTSTSTGGSKKVALDQALRDISPDAFKKFDNQLAAEIGPILAPFGIKVTSNNGGAGNNYITVDLPTGNTFTVDANEYWGGDGAKENLVKNIQKYITEENANQVLSNSGVVVPPAMQNAGAQFNDN